MALVSAQGPPEDGAMATPSVAQVLDATWFASDLPAAARERLAALGRLAEVPEGGFGVREGTICQSLGVVGSGRIALRLALPGGQERTILTVEAGDVFGWSAVLPQPTATATGVAVLPSTVVLVDAGRLRAALATDCELAAAIYERLFASVVRRLSATRLQLLDLYRPGLEPW
jgi:CRP/FNR family cyclic AMP-dependent transcriptional regulator